MASKSGKKQGWAEEASNHELQVLGDVPSQGSVESDRPRLPGVPLWPPYTCTYTLVCTHYTYTHILPPFHTLRHDANTHSHFRSRLCPASGLSIGDFCSLVFKVSVDHCGIPTPTPAPPCVCWGGAGESMFLPQTTASSSSLNDTKLVSPC